MRVESCWHTYPLYIPCSVAVEWFQTSFGHFAIFDPLTSNFALDRPPMQESWLAKLLWGIFFGALGCGQLGRCGAVCAHAGLRVGLRLLGRVARVFSTRLSIICTRYPLRGNNDGNKIWFLDICLRRPFPLSECLRRRLSNITKTGDTLERCLGHKRTCL